MLFGQGPLGATQGDSTSLRWWFDVQYRFQDNPGDFQQVILRPGIGYAVTRRSTLWLGYARINTEQDSGGFDEDRLWQQWTWSERYRSLAVLSRTRLEQLDVEQGDDVGWRLRQFIKLSRPLQTIARWSLVAYDELFFDLNDTDWGNSRGFSQNRLFVGLAWHISQSDDKSLEVGYLNQYINGRSDLNTVNHLLSVNFLF